MIALADVPTPGRVRATASTASAAPPPDGETSGIMGPSHGKAPQSYLTFLGSTACAIGAVPLGPAVVMVLNAQPATYTVTWTRRAL